jgi:hypothetical protein
MQSFKVPEHALGNLASYSGRSTEDSAHFNDWSSLIWRLTEASSESEIQTQDIVSDGRGSVANDPESSRFWMLFAMSIKEEGPIHRGGEHYRLDKPVLLLLDSPTLAQSDRVQLEFAEFEHS